MTRSRTVAIVRIVVAVAVVVALVWGVARNWTEISQDLQRVSIGALLLSFVPAALGTWLTMVGWRVILADLGSPLHLAPAGGVFFVGQLGKYLPGSVWTVLVQADMASHLHVPRRRTGVTGLVTIGLSVLTGLLVGLPALPLLLQRSAGSSGWLLPRRPAVGRPGVARVAEPAHRLGPAGPAPRTAGGDPLHAGHPHDRGPVCAGVGAVRGAHPRPRARCGRGYGRDPGLADRVSPWPASLRHADGDPPGGPRCPRRHPRASSSRRPCRSRPGRPSRSSPGSS